MAGIEPHASHSLVKQGYAALTARPAVSSGVDRRPRMLMQRTGSDPFAGDSAGYGPSSGSEGQGGPSPGGSCSTGTEYLGAGCADPGQRHASHGIRVLGIRRADGRLLLIPILARRSGPAAVCVRRFPQRAGRQTRRPAARTAVHLSPESHNAGLSAGGVAVDPARTGDGPWAAWPSRAPSPFWPARPGAHAVGARE